jgi:transposase
MGFIGYLWCIAKIWLGSPTGRQRFNVLGALNAVTHEVITICNSTFINAWSVIDLLWKLRKRYLQTGIPITLVLDNAGYQNCAIVRGTAALMGIELMYLPPYSPNLNLIERLWKFVKKKALRSVEYASFDDFCSGVQSCVEKAHVNYREELNSLLTWNFQVLPDITKKAA